LKKNVKTIYRFHKLVFDRATLNVSTALLKTMGYGSRFQSDIVRGDIVDFQEFYLESNKYQLIPFYDQ